MIPKISRKEKIFKIKAEINEIYMRKTTEKINKIKSWIFEEKNKNSKLLARLKKKERNSNK